MEHPGLMRGQGKAQGNKHREKEGTQEETIHPLMAHTASHNHSQTVDLPETPDHSSSRNCIKYIPLILFH